MIEPLLIFGVMATFALVTRSWSREGLPRCPRCGRVINRERLDRWRSGGSQWSTDKANDFVECRHCQAHFSPNDGASPEELARGQVRHGPQVVGMPCAVCGVRVVFDSEATPCPTCEKPVHLTCLPHAHGGEALGPYRR